MSIIKKLIQHIKQRLSGSRGALTGTIKFYDRKKRFGFIVSGQNEYFFHAAAMAVPDLRALKDGVAVKFNLVQGKKGLQADHIEILDRRH